MSTPPDTWVPRRRTTIVILDSGSGDVERFTLPGNFEPEAFSTRARGLFALRFQPALVPTTYRVTQLRLRSGDVRPVYGPSKAAKVVENMTATRVHHAMSPGENVLYTLYTNQPPDFLADSADVDPEHALAFIHTLDLRNGTAVCIGLPKSFGTVSRAASALAASPVGGAVYAIDARGGTVASMIGRTFTVEEHRVDLSELGRGPVSARVSSDGDSLFIAGAAGILALDTETFEPLPFAPTPAPVTGIALSGDGDRLFASWDGGIGLLEPTTLATVGIVPSPVPGRRDVRRRGLSRRQARGSTCADGPRWHGGEREPREPDVHAQVARAHDLRDRGGQADRIPQRPEYRVLRGQTMLRVRFECPDRVELTGGTERLARDRHPEVRGDHEQVQAYTHHQEDESGRAKIETDEHQEHRERDNERNVVEVAGPRDHLQGQADRRQPP
jgi:hypothetical protein